ncbi:hypothetical protein SUNI508_12073 [Seiridium unicorne]|uniref:Helicase ATP-binding domain-containing protein n=1 Tax=Seiridium unicorne TaxID=138068 RepID=A0ABR2UEQ5_9PEZI
MASSDDSEASNSPKVTTVDSEMTIDTDEDIAMSRLPSRNTGKPVPRGKKRKVDAPSMPTKDNSEPDEATAPPSRTNGLDNSLPPIDNVYDAFQDLLKRIIGNDNQVFPDLLELAKNGGFVINVGTMCSGTEAPVFALKLLQDEFYSLTGIELFRMNQEYAVEIEPFKQAYIRRNTDAKVFRDVRDFGSPDVLATDLTTALGSLARVPYNRPHILIVGTSCIAFSRLSVTQQKGFNPAAGELQKYLQTAKDNGEEADRAKVSALLGKIVSTLDMSESDSTFFPVLSFILHQRPSLVIFENVQDAPWLDTQDWFCPAIGYTARFLSCDTKDYYMPQTRQRKYLIAFDNDVFGKGAVENMANDAMGFLKCLQRRASVDVEKYLYNNMDKAIQTDMQQMEFEKSSKTLKDASWWFSQQRHEDTRQKEGLGNEHPFSGLKSTGETLFYDRANKTIMNRYPDRVKDSCDISLLRGLSASPSFDSRFKVKIYDYSQNVDRELGNIPFGISGCLTPSGAAFLSNQSRWIMGREYLLLQGLPVRALSLSRETYDQLKNLAGNAMTTTVVAASFLSAIMAIMKNAPESMFPPIDENDEKYTGPRSSGLNPTLVHSTLQQVTDFGTRTFEEATTGAILDLATRLRVYCFCTGTAMFSSAILWRCTICGTIRCSNCKGNPKHEYEKLDLVPEAFGQEGAMLRLMKHVPRVFQGMFTAPLASRVVTEFDNVMELRELGSKKVSSTLEKAIFYFDRVHFSETISICYIASSGFTLKVMIDTDSVSWYLFLDAHSDLGNELATGTTDERTETHHLSTGLRDFCLSGRPIARARLTDRKLSSIPSANQWTPWNFQQPFRMIKDSKVFNARVIIKKSEDGSKIEIDSILDDTYFATPQARSIINSVLGTWIHKPDCDVAESSLFIPDNDKERKLFLFKDPSRIGPAALDAFVVSETPRLLQWHEHREILLTFVPLADFSKQIHKLQAGTHILKVTMDGFWDTSYAEKTPIPGHLSQGIPERFERLETATDLDGSSTSCNDDNHLLAEMDFARGDKQPDRVLLKASWVCTNGDGWANIDKRDQADFFKSIAFVVPSLIYSMKPISTKTIPLGQPNLCGTCSPEFPPVYWVSQSETGVMQPVHKPDEVATYEVGVRHQLPAFQVMAKVPSYDEGQKQRNDTISVKMTINPSRLAHRALAFLPDICDTLSQDTGRLTLKAFTEPGHSDSLVFNLKPFAQSIPTLKRISGGEYEQPFNFPSGLSLDENQLITVGHMLHREKWPSSFKEREDEEEVVPGIPLRIVGRAEREVQCAGGIIADAVGAGKTVMTLALIDHQYSHDLDGQSKRDEKSSETGAKALSATLLLVPEHIIDQWVQEILRFLEHFTKKDVLVLKVMRDLTSVENLKKIEKAKIVVASDKLFKENAYRAELSRFAGVGDPGKAPSERASREWHRKCVLNIRAYLGDYLDDPSSKSARDTLARKINDDYRQYQEANQQLVDGMVKQSSRKGAKDNRTTKAKPKSTKAKQSTSMKARNINGSKMFMNSCILFEYFSWARIVWDEVSYRNTDVAQFLSTAVADHKWLLSGTPPRQNLSDIDYMARSLGISLARPIDLRLGLPPVTKGPSESTRTDTELCCSYGRLKSDKFVKDRHEQAELFLEGFSCSNKAAILKVKVFERIIVCSPTLLEKTIYLEKQQVWRRAQMMSDYLDVDDLLGMLHDIGHAPGTPFPDDLSSRSLTYGASLPGLGRAAGFSVGKVCQNRFEILQDTKDYIRLLFQQAVWLASRLQHCTANLPKGKTTRDADYVAKTTTSFRRLVSGMQAGQFQIFGGMEAYLMLLKALAPQFKLTVQQKTELLKIENAERGIDLVALLSDQMVSGHPMRGGDDPSILYNLYDAGKFAWPHFYKLTPKDIDGLDLKNTLHLAREYLVRCSSDASQQNITAEDLISMTPDELKQTLKRFLEAVELDQNKRRRSLANPDFEEKHLADKTKDSLVAEARVRGLKVSSTARRDAILSLIKAHEEGGAGQKNYDQPNLRALLPADCPPKLDDNLKIRGSSVSATENAFKETLNLFNKAIQVLVKHNNQFRRARMFLRLQSGSQIHCMQCRARDDLKANLDCGHVVCTDCLGDRELCGEGTTGCKTVVEYNAVRVADLFTPQRALGLFGNNPRPATTRPTNGYSSKINTVVDTIKQIPKGDAVVVFSQYDDIINQIIKALSDSGVDARTTSKLPNVKAAAKGKPASVVEGFKRGEFGVLVLKVDAPEASGANLVIANHVIFATPLATDTQDLYETCMEQAKGRCARRGQTKDVHFYHCVVEGTIEVDMLEARTKKHVRVEPGQALGWLVPRESNDELGYSARVNSLLRQPEIWKALGETDYTTIAGFDQSVGVRETTVGMKELEIHAEYTSTKAASTKIASTKDACIPS